MPAVMSSRVRMGLSDVLAVHPADTLRVLRGPRIAALRYRGRNLVPLLPRRLVTRAFEGRAFHARAVTSLTLVALGVHGGIPLRRIGLATFTSSLGASVHVAG